MGERGEKFQSLAISCSPLSPSVLALPFTEPLFSGTIRLQEVGRPLECASAYSRGKSGLH